MYLLCFVYCVCTIVVTGIGIFTVFTVTIPHKQTYNRMESNANLFGKLIPLHSLPVWFHSTTNKDNYSCTVCSLAFVWR